MKFRPTLVVLVIALGMALGWSTSRAEEDQSCEVACRDQQQACIEICSEHSNPVECEAGCRDDAYDCEERCR
jgi:hypothetical protein